MVNLVLVRPESDPVEVGLSSWAALVLASIGGAFRVSTVDLRAQQVTRTAVEGAIGAHDATLFFSHGTRDHLGSPTPCVDSANVSKAQGKVLIAFSCMAGEQLGLDAVSNGVRAFLGFDDILTNYHPQPSLFGQIVDIALRPFLLSGQPIHAVRSALKWGFQSIEQHYTKGPGANHANANLIWMAAHINQRALVLHGDPNAVIP